MTKVSVHEAKTHLSRLLQRVAAGEEIVITKSGRVVAKLAPVELPPQSRIPGQDVGKGFIASDFDEPLPDDVLRDFHAYTD